MKNSIGSNIKYYRKQLGLTQEELAGQLFVTSQAVSKWESDAGLPDTAQIVPLAKVLNISTDALFGLEQGNYDAVTAAKVHVKFRELRSQIDKKKGALEACEYLLSECEANPLNFEIYMYFVQSVANLSRNIDPFGEYKKGMNETYDKYFDEALKKSVQVIRYCKEEDFVEKTHFALSWIYIHCKEYEKAREHIAKLPSIKSNMLKESILAKLEGFENGVEAQLKAQHNNSQLMCLPFNKEFVYSAETYFWNKPELAAGYCEWALNIIFAICKDQTMKPFCQGFVKDLYAFKICSELKSGSAEDVKAAREDFAALKKLIYDYVDFCAAELERKDLLNAYDEKGILNMKLYTKEDGDRRIKELEEKIRNWCGEEVLKKVL